MEAEGEIDCHSVPQSKEEAWELWKRLMSQRFVNGRDNQFDYRTVDNSDDLDRGSDENGRAHDDYFDQQEAEWAVPTSEIQGETGVQDF